MATKDGDGLTINRYGGVSRNGRRHGGSIVASNDAFDFPTSAMISAKEKSFMNMVDFGCAAPIVSRRLILIYIDENESNISRKKEVKRFNESGISRKKEVKRCNESDILRKKEVKRFIHGFGLEGCRRFPMKEVKQALVKAQDETHGKTEQSVTSTSHNAEELLLSRDTFAPRDMKSSIYHSPLYRAVSMS